MKVTDHHMFLQLTKREKLRVLYADGDFIIAIRYYGYKVNLYRLGNFLVEVFFNHKKDVIEKIEVLSGNITRLKFYSDQIKLPPFKI